MKKTNQIYKKKTFASFWLKSLCGFLSVKKKKKIITMQ